MELHQLLRIITNNTKIILCDLSGLQLVKVTDKNMIPLDLYEEEVFMISCGYYDNYSRDNSLYIMLKK